MNHSRDGSTGKTDGGRGWHRRVKVLLADDHRMFREGIAGVLASSYAEEVEVVGKTDTGEEAVVLARKEKPDVVIMQVDEKLEKAKETLSQILLVDATTPPKVIILTMFEDPRILREVMKLGSNTFVHKSASVEELLSAMRTTLDYPTGGNVVMVMPQGALEASEDGAGGDILTKRELEVVVLAARGMSNPQIAHHLGLSEGTVKRHLANLYPKMGVNSRGEAVRKALDNEWLTIHEITADVDNG